MDWTCNLKKGMVKDNWGFGQSFHFVWIVVLFAEMVETQETRSFCESRWNNDFHSGRVKCELMRHADGALQHLLPERGKGESKDAARLGSAGGETCQEAVRPEGQMEKAFHGAPSWGLLRPRRTESQALDLTNGGFNWPWGKSLVAWQGRESRWRRLRREWEVSSWDNKYNQLWGISLFKGAEKWGGCGGLGFQRGVFVIFRSKRCYRIFPCQKDGPH